MVEQRPSGWYDDPRDDSLLRYWDGVVWTDHVANKRPTPAAEPISEPAAGASGEQWAAYRAQQSARRDSSRPEGTRGARGSRGVSPGDGAPLSGWWRRVLAMVIDVLLVGLISMPLTWTRAMRSSEALSSYGDALISAATSGAAAPQPPQQLLVDIAVISLVQTALYVVLEAALLARSGVTPGRRVAGIRVRPVGLDEPVPFVVGVRRSLVKNVSNLLGGVPLLSTFALGFQIADYLWPLRDRGRQALHDKAAGTQVVRSGPLRGRGRGRGRHSDPA